jgi:anaerobic magnesium-protoporphyrin IX monomethyl ester cyclase
MKDLTEIDRVAGIVYRRGGKIHVTVPRPRLKDLDALPFPDISDVPTEKYFDYEEQNLPGLWKRAYLSASRGCAYACSFCSQAVFWGQRDTFRSARSILNEMEYYYNKFGLRRFYFYDDTITDWPGLTEFCKLNNSCGFLWSCSTRIDKVDSRILETMATGGCREIAFGLESGAKRTLTAVQKAWELRRSPEQVGDCVEMCANLGIVPRAHFMIGFPREEKEDITETVRFAVSLKSRELRDANFFVVKVYPGTVFHATEAKDIARQQGFSEQEMYSSWSVYDWHSTRNPKVAAKLRRFNDIPRISAHPNLGNLALRQLVRNAYEIFFSDLTTDDVDDHLWRGVHWEWKEDHEEVVVAPAQINDGAFTV